MISFQTHRGVRLKSELAKNLDFTQVPLSGHSGFQTFNVLSKTQNLGDPHYKMYVDQVLDISYNLTDKQKMLAEYYDNKFIALPAAFEFAVQNAQLSMEDATVMDLIGE